MNNVMTMFDGLPPRGQAADLLILKKERTFDLTLSGSARGQDMTGRRFQEKVTIRSISSQKVVFTLLADPNIGTRITLTVDIPRTLMLGEPMRLVITGLVHALERDRTSSGHKKVRLGLDRRFRVQTAD